MINKDYEVKVFCPICKDGNNIIWKGSLLEWRNELVNPIPPKWFIYAMNHKRAHDHKIMVEYPDRIVPLDLLNSETW